MVLPQSVVHGLRPHAHGLSTGPARGGPEPGTLPEMQDIITAYLEGEGQGVITAAKARHLGCSHAVLRGMERAKLVVRVARGAYVSARMFNPPSDHPAATDAFTLQEHRHLLRLDALAQTYGDKVAASHQSAVLAWGLPTQRSSLDRVHLVHAAGGRTTRRFDTFTIHTCELAEVVTTHHGRLLVVAPLAVIGQAITVGVAQGVAAMDAAIVGELTTMSELAAMLERMRHTPRLGLARRAVSLADGLAESPGETRLRLVLLELEMTFTAQHWVCTENGRHYRVDCYLPELGVVLEYDGRGKYDGQRRKGAGDHRDGSDAAAAGRQALAEEKVREDDLRLDGFGVGRVTAANLTARRVAAIVAAASKQARARAVRRPAEPPTWAVQG